MLGHVELSRLKLIWSIVHHDASASDHTVITNIILAMACREHSLKIIYDNLNSVSALLIQEPMGTVLVFPMKLVTGTGCSSKGYAWTDFKAWHLPMSIISCKIIMEHKSGIPTSRDSFRCAEETAMITLGSPTSTSPERCAIAIFVNCHLAAAARHISCKRMFFCEVQQENTMCASQAPLVDIQNHGNKCRKLAK
jgi:hypothetical protein